MLTKRRQEWSNVEILGHFLFNSALGRSSDNIDEWLIVRIVRSLLKRFGLNGDNKVVSSAICCPLYPEWRFAEGKRCLCVFENFSRLHRRTIALSHFVYGEDDGWVHFHIFARNFFVNYLNEHANHSQSIVLGEGIRETSIGGIVEDEMDLNKACLFLIF